jgi:chemotaxis protein MotA
MDIATIVGTILSFGLVIGAIIIGGGSIGAFVDYPSVMCVFGGCIAAVLMCFPLKNFLNMGRVILKTFFYKQDSVSALIDTIVELAETARRDGLLALEAKISQISNPFIVLGIQMAVDGTRPDVIEDILRTEVDAVATRHRDGKSVLDQMGRFAPAFGMIGTLIGLVIMLGDMNDPAKIGSGMAVALLTTLYGAVASNGFFLPLSEKLNFLNKQELLSMEIIVRGIMGIQSGDNPRVIAQKLTTFIPPKQRVGAREAA